MSQIARTISREIKQNRIQKLESQMKNLFNTPIHLMDNNIVKLYNDKLIEWKELTNYKQL